MIIIKNNLEAPVSVFGPWRTLENNALSSLHLLFRNRLVSVSGVGVVVTPTPFSIAGSVTINAKRTVLVSDRFNGVRSPKFIWAPVYSGPPPPHLGSYYTSALLVSQDGRLLFVP
jgi:hypothetical protein